MATSNAAVDRYQSFIGIPCDANADRLIDCLDEFIEAGRGDERWHAYFRGKREQQIRMNHDNLYFVGSQMNSLIAYFEECDDPEAMDLLWQVEQECC